MRETVNKIISYFVEIRKFDEIHINHMHELYPDKVSEDYLEGYLAAYKECMDHLRDACVDLILNDDEGTK